LITTTGYQVRTFCVECGKTIGAAFKQEPTDRELPEIDPSVIRAYEDSRTRVLEAIKTKHRNIQERRESSWNENYEKYINSDEWKEKRSIVLKRANFVCEGCAKNTATEVHHLTYRHFGDELLFELVAVCRACHEKVHQGHSDGENDEASGDQPDDLDELPDDYFPEPPCCGCRFANGEYGSRAECFILEEPIETAIAEGGECGPKRRLFEPLK
jgi:hypothetical protein